MKIHKYFKYFFVCILNIYAIISFSQNTFYFGNFPFNNNDYYFKTTTPKVYQTSDTWFEVIPYVTYSNGQTLMMGNGYQFLFLQKNSQTFYGIIWSENKSDLPTDLNTFKAGNYISDTPPKNCKIIVNGKWEQYGLNFFVGDGTNGTKKLKPNTTYYYMFIGCSLYNSNIHVLLLGPIENRTTLASAVYSNYAITSLPYACPNFMPVITDASHQTSGVNYTYVWTKQPPNGNPVQLTAVTGNSYQPPASDFTSISNTDPTTITYVRKTTATQNNQTTDGYDVATITYYPSGTTMPSVQTFFGSYLTYSTDPNNSGKILIKAKDAVYSNGYTIQWQQKTSFTGSWTNYSATTGNDISVAATDANYYQAVLSYGCATSTTEPIQPNSVPSSATYTTIGTQTWMISDLKVNTFNDGTAIPATTDWNTWKSSTTPYYYDPGSSNGYLYNKYVILTTKNVCPAGWKVPSDAEWSTLSSNNTLLSLASTTWLNISGSNAGTNSTGFKALPIGFIDGSGTSLSLTNKATEAVWWSDNPNPAHWYILNGQSALKSGQLGGINGFNIRCIKR